MVLLLKVKIMSAHWEVGHLTCSKTPNKALFQLQLVNVFISRNHQQLLLIATRWQLWPSALRYITPLLHMTPNGAPLLNAYDAKLHQGWSITLEAYIFATNRCRWGIWRGVWSCSTPICHNVLGVMGDESTLALLWRHMRSEGRSILASYAFRRLVNLVFYAVKG